MLKAEQRTVSKAAQKMVLKAELRTILKTEQSVVPKKAEDYILDKDSHQGGAEDHLKFVTRDCLKAGLKTAWRRERLTRRRRKDEDVIILKVSR